MSHVDDGQLHAYLDGALDGGVSQDGPAIRGSGSLEGAADGAIGGAGLADQERRRIEDHLQVCPDCRRRLEAARAHREGAREIMGLLGPERVQAPPFEELLARRTEVGGKGEEAGAGAAGRVARGGSSGESSGRSGGVPGPGPGSVVRIAWAATVLLALGGGWMARGALMPSPSLDAPGADEEALRLPGPVASREEAAAAPPPAPSDPTAPAAGARAMAGPPEAADDRARTSADRVVEEPEVAEAVPPSARDEVAAEPPPPETIALETLTPGPPTVDALAPGALAMEAAASRTVAPLPGESVAEALLARELRATRDGSWRAVSPAEAAHVLGQLPLELEGVPWARMESAEVDGEVVVRTVHPLDPDGSVELVQGRRLEGAGRIGDGPLGRALLPPGAGPGEHPVRTLSAERGGLVLLLRGTGDLETLEGFLRRVR